MWESIKNFFQSIAYRTGISWIARKISSGWNWLLSSKKNTTQENISPKRPSDENVNKSPTVSTPMQNETEEPVSKTGTNVEPAENFPERLNDEPKAVGEIKFKDNQFYLSLNRPLAEGEYKNLNNRVNSLTKLLVYVKCDNNGYKIVGDGNDFNNITSVHIESITKKNEDGRYLSCNAIYSRKNTYRIKEMLGLKDDVTEIKVDNISNQPFEGTALEQHNLNPTTAQQMVNNKEVTTESEEFYDAEVTQPSPTIGVSSTERHYVTNPSVD
ncbi:hypothetical protein [Wolbachia endosymbiont (group B) of Melanostoma mellinum]|uniref:hypothetical protein n=1 Tax=Wolbachia endosymbiont (group B) of Melanostoma mellinum TaxID=2954030 RepID=UPI0022312394|nr:hypothetical protein [Wolbachia endosymbiont (group B) of Melanostoma mellinum]